MAGGIKIKYAFISQSDFSNILTFIFLSSFFLASNQSLSVFWKMKKIATKNVLYVYSLLVSRKKISFPKKYLTVENSTRQAFPAHRQRLEITMMDAFCQLLFHDFEVFF